MEDVPTSTSMAGYEKHETAQDSFGQNGNHFNIIEEKLGSTEATLFSTRKIGSPTKVRRKDDGPLAQCCELLVEHQIGLSVNLLILLGLTHLCFPRARRQTRKFFELSYYNPESGEYTQGWDDAYMVFYWFVLFTALRASVMDYILMPFARWAGIGDKKGLVRFAEQAWLLVYCSVSWPTGVFIVYQSDYWFNIKAVWANWPNREIGGLLKWYILVQYAFWLQQIIVINIEKRRKHYWQMFTHHIITCALLFTSYGYHQTKVGNVILCLMDLVDILLPLAKCLKYLNIKVWPDVVFGLFIVTWVMTRHVLYLMVCYSVWADIPVEISLGCYEGKKGSLRGPFPAPDRFNHLIDPFRNPEGVVCFNESIKWAFLFALLSLQCILVLWFSMIARVAVKVLRDGEAEDVRSDDEEEEEEEEEDEEEYEMLQPGGYEKLEPIEMVPLEEEVGVEGINLNGRTRSSKRYKKTSSSSSGLDRKELLGRIGCDKGV